jgi:hypothetical protein
MFVKRIKIVLVYINFSLRGRPQFYGGPDLQQAWFWWHGGGLRACRKDNLSWLHAVQILDGEYDHLIGQYQDSEKP